MCTFALEDVSLQILQKATQPDRCVAISRRGPLKEIIPSSTIASINKDVGMELIKEALKERRPYSKLTPSQKALIGKRAVNSLHEVLSS